MPPQAPRRRAALAFLALALALAAAALWTRGWQARLRQINAPIAQIALREASHIALFQECERAALRDRPRDPLILAIRAGSCLSIRAPADAPLSPSAALLSLHSLSAQSARALLSGQSPSDAQAIAAPLAQRAATQALLDERALLAADARLAALCQSLGAWLCRLSGADPSRPYGPAASERHEMIHALAFRSERPQETLDWIEAGSPQPDPSLAEGRARAQAARSAPQPPAP